MNNNNIFIKTFYKCISIVKTTILSILAQINKTLYF